MRNQEAAGTGGTPQLIGSRLGSYRIVSHLGSGGMGQVYRAYDERLQRDVAVKVLSSDAAADPGRAARFLQEAQAAAAIDHPSIVAVHDFGEHHQRQFLVTELLEGSTLRQLSERGELTCAHVVEFGIQVARGLAAAHARGIVHRDLTPDNVMVTSDGRVKILDFGIARLKERHLRDVRASPVVQDVGTVPGTLLGTIGYMAPEQIRGLPAEPACDIFSLGCALYEGISGRRPFPGDSAADILSAILRDEPAPLNGVSTELEGVVRRCLAKRAEDRFGSAADVALALEAVRGDPPRQGHAPTADASSPYPGMEAFTRANSRYFFGRESEITDIWRRIATRPLLALIGSSGAGKTSLVQAGIATNPPSGWRVVVSQPGRSPASNLARALVPELSGDTDALGLLVDFADPDVAVATTARWRRRHDSVLLIVDQLEELFTLNPVAEQQEFSALLGRLVDEADVHLLLSLRDDYLMHCSRHQALHRVFENLVPIGQLTLASVRRAMVEPARRCGYSFEDDELVEEILAEVAGERNPLPLLAFAMGQLWERRDRQRRLLTREVYHGIGGIGGALAQHAERRLERIGPERLHLVRELFRNLVTAEGTRAVWDVPELLSIFPENERQAADEVLRDLTDARLLTLYKSADDEGATLRKVEIIHESLLTAWPRLACWRARDAESAQLRQQLQQAARIWEQRGRPRDLLWTGTAYREYRLWREHYTGGVTELERSFERAMVAHAGRRERRRRVLMALASALVLGFTAVIGVLWRSSEGERRRAEAARVLALAQLELDADPSASLAYATHSLSLDDSRATREFVIEALWRGPPASLLPLPGGQWWSLDFSPDGASLAVADTDETVLVWPRTGGPPVALVDREAGPRPHQVRFGASPETLLVGSGEMLVAGSLESKQHSVAVWSVPARTPVRRLELGRARVVSQSSTHLVPPRSRALLTLSKRPAAGGGVLRAVELPDGEEKVVGRLAAAAEVSDPARSGTVVVDPSYEWLAWSDGKQVLAGRIAALETAPPVVVGTHHSEILDLVFASPDRLISRDATGEAVVWERSADGWHRIRTMTGLPPAYWVAVDARGDRVAAGMRSEQSIALWDLRAPPEAQPTMLRRDFQVPVDELAFGDDDTWLAVAHRTGVSFWPMTARQPWVLEGHGSPVTALAFAPDGSWLVSGGRDGVLRQWDLGEGPKRPVRTLLASHSPENQFGTIYGIVPLGSGDRVLATIQQQAGVFLVPADGEGPPSHLEMPGIAPFAAAADRSGRFIAVGAGYSMTRAEKIIRIWNLESGSVRDLDLLQGLAAEYAAGPYGGCVVNLDFAPDGRLISSGYGGVRAWDPGSGSSETILEAWQSTMDLSDDGRRVVAASHPDADSTDISVVRVVDLESGSSWHLDSHGYSAAAVAFDPSGEVVVTGDRDGVVRVGPATGEAPFLLLGHEGPVVEVAVSPDGRRIASAGYDGTVRVWPMPDLSQPPLHTLPRERLLATLRSLTNLRTVEDESSPSGYAIKPAPFPGWAHPPSW